MPIIVNDYKVLSRCRRLEPDIRREVATLRDYLIGLLITVAFFAIVFGGGALLGNDWAKIVITEIKDIF